MLGLGSILVCSQKTKERNRTSLGMGLISGLGRAQAMKELEPSCQNSCWPCSSGARSPCLRKPLLQLLEPGGLEPAIPKRSLRTHP